MHVTLLGYRESFVVVLLVCWFVGCWLLFVDSEAIHDSYGDEKDIHTAFSQVCTRVNYGNNLCLYARDVGL